MRRIIILIDPEVDMVIAAVRQQAARASETCLTMEESSEVFRQYNELAHEIEMQKRIQST